MSRSVLRSLSCFSFLQLTAAFLASLLLLVGCDTDVQVLDPSPNHIFSLYGVLDPARDTQWIRVEPLAKPTSGGAPPTIDATVHLENLDTGRSWTLHDSLMLVQTEPQHNFWTTAPIEPETSYRLTARRSDGASSSATTTTPAHPPSILFLRTEDSSSHPVLVTEIDQLAGLKVKYFSLVGPVHDVSYYKYTQQTSAGYNSTIRPTRDIDRLGILGIDSARVVATAGGPDWPRWDRYRNATIKDLARSDSFSNVDGGLGMVSGVYSTTKLIP